MSADQKQKLVAELTEILERLVRLVRELKASGLDPEDIAGALPTALLQTVEGLFNE